MGCTSNMGRSYKHTIFVVLLNILVCTGLKFHMDLKESRCFAVNAEHNSLYQATYKLKWKKPNASKYVNVPHDFKLLVRVIDDKNNIMVSKSYPSHGIFAFHTNIDTKSILNQLKLVKDKDFHYQVCITADE